MISKPKYSAELGGTCCKEQRATGFRRFDCGRFRKPFDENLAAGAPAMLAAANCLPLLSRGRIANLPLPASRSWSSFVLAANLWIHNHGCSQNAPV
jgi:hypothetical protein